MHVGPRERDARQRGCGALEAQRQLTASQAELTTLRTNPRYEEMLDLAANGARVLMEMVDRPAKGFAVGDAVRMRLRIKSLNARLGFRTYFWKAAPLARPTLGDA